MEKETLIALLGVMIGGGISYIVGINLQNRHFKKEENDKKDILRSQLETLVSEINDEYIRLQNLRNLIQGDGYPREHFDVTIKKAILAEMVKTKLYPQNKPIFNRVNSLINRLMILNREIGSMQDLIGAYCSTRYQKAKIRQERDATVGVIDDILVQNIREQKDKPELCVQLESIIKNLK